MKIDGSVYFTRKENRHFGGNSNRMEKEDGENVSVMDDDGHAIFYMVPDVLLEDFREWMKGIFENIEDSGDNTYHVSGAQCR